MTVQLDIWRKHSMVVSMKKSVSLHDVLVLLAGFWSLIGRYDN